MIFSFDELKLVAARLISLSVLLRSARRRAMKHGYPSKVLITGGREFGGIKSFAEGLRAEFTELGIAVEIISPLRIFLRWRDLRNPRIHGLGRNCRHGSGGRLSIAHQHHVSFEGKTGNSLKLHIAQLSVWNLFLEIKGRGTGL
jgi:hypothetical protein